MTNIFGLNLNELTALITALKLPKFRARQIIEWLYLKHATSFETGQLNHLFRIFLEPIRV